MRVSLAPAAFHIALHAVTFLLDYPLENKVKSAICPAAVIAGGRPLSLSCGNLMCSFFTLKPNAQ